MNMHLTSAHIYLAPQRSRVTVSIPHVPKLQTVISVMTTNRNWQVFSGKVQHVLTYKQCGDSKSVEFKINL